MKLDYDSDVDVLYVRLTSSQISESDEVQPGFIVDYDEGGTVVGFEVLHASRKVENLPTVELSNLKSLAPA